jgi:hypothetical protein
MEVEDGAAPQPSVQARKAARGWPATLDGRRAGAALTSPQSLRAWPPDNGRSSRRPRVTRLHRRKTEIERCQHTGQISIPGRNCESAPAPLGGQKLGQVGLVGAKPFPRGAKPPHAVPPIAAVAAAFVIVLGITVSIAHTQWSAVPGEQHVASTQARDDRRAAQLREIDVLDKGRASFLAWPKSSRICRFVSLSLCFFKAGMRKIAAFLLSRELEGKLRGTVSLRYGATLLLLKLLLNALVLTGIETNGERRRREKQ